MYAQWSFSSLCIVLHVHARQRLVDHKEKQQFVWVMFHKKEAFAVMTSRHHFSALCDFSSEWRNILENYFSLHFPLFKYVSMFHFKTKIIIYWTSSIAKTSDAMLPSLKSRSYDYVKNSLMWKRSSLLQRSCKFRSLSRPVQKVNMLR
jgi:hypothetical protein